MSRPACSWRHSPAELIGARLAGAAHGVLDLDGERGFDGIDVHALHFHDVAEPLLQGGGDGELRRRRKRIAVRGEDELQQAAAEVGTIHPLAGRGEEELLDHVADVVVVIGQRRAAAAVDAEWLVDMHATTPRLSSASLRRSAERRSARRWPDSPAAAADARSMSRAWRRGCTARARM